MLDFLARNLTRDNITFVLAILGSIGALTSWLNIYLSQRKKFRISIAELISNKKGCLFYMMFENQSRLPISITRLILIDHSHRIDCVVIPKLVHEITRTQGVEVIERRTDYSLPFPILLPPLAATSGYILFEDDRSLLKEGTKSATFEVCTNRGKMNKIELELSESARHSKRRI